MKKLYSRSRFISIVASVAVVVLVMGSRVPAQGQNPFQEIRDALAGLQTSVNSLQSSLNLLTVPEQANVRVTPPVVRPLTGVHVASCTYVNVTDATKTIQLELFDHLGTVLMSRTDQASAGNAGGFVVGIETPIVYCKFTSVGGSRTDIRGSVELRSTDNTVIKSLAAE